MASGVEVVVVGGHSHLSAAPLHVLDESSNAASDVAFGTRGLVDRSHGHRDVPVARLMRIGVDPRRSAGGSPVGLPKALGGQWSATRAKEEWNLVQVDQLIVSPTQVVGNR